MLRFYNRLTRKKEIFKPYNHDCVTMYSCGPTVYGFQHIGNLRAYVFMDIIRRTLKARGYKINGAMNITDVGHLTSDEDEGEDKMLLASKREHKSPYKIAEYYSQIFFNDIKKLNIEFPEHVLKATEHIQDMVDYISKLFEKGYAYETSKGIYFSVEKFKNYGCLSGVNVNDKKAGARIEVDSEKHNPADFALWIKAPKEHIMQWDSPWGMGYPGWHIECSVMGQKYLGKHIDIHTGGIDHVTVHHENEIAQNDSLCEHQVVKFWMELEFLQIDGKKMSKSLGNIYTLANLEDKGFSALDYRYFLLQAHYLKMQNFTFEALDGAKSSLSNLFKAVRKHKDSQYIQSDLSSFENRFFEAIEDDLNTPLALGVIWDLLRTQPNKFVYELILKCDSILGLSIEENVTHKQIIPDDIEKLAKDRWQAKINKNYSLADDYRKQIEIAGYLVKDLKDGYVVEKL